MRLEPPTPRIRTVLSGILTVGVVVVIFVKIIPRIADPGQVGDVLRSHVSPAELAALLALTTASIIASAGSLAAGLPGLRIMPAAVINVVTTAVSYAVPAGAAAGTALNVAMLRKLRFTPSAIAVEVLATGIWNLGVRLVLPLLALGLAGLTAEVPPGVRGAAAGGLVLAAGLTFLIAAVVWWEPAAAFAARALTRLARLLPGDHTVHRDRADLFQSDVRNLIRSRWVPLTASTLGYHLAVFGVLYLSLQAVGVTQAGVLETFAVYAVARQVTAIPITPGSVGIIELALIGGLGLTGADLPEVTAGVLLFRFFTYFLYLPTGGILWFWWSWAHRPSRGEVAPVFRHPADLFRALLGVAVLLIAVAFSRDLDAPEVGLFRLVNDLPDAVELPLWAVMQAGWLGAVAVCALVALVARRVRLSVDLVVAGSAAWALAKVVKDIAGRPRPGGLLQDVVLRGDVYPGGIGFVAGHCAVAAALATVLSASLPRPYRRLLWAVVAAVGFSRVYVGAHLPWDIVGGTALGWATGAAVLFCRGTTAHIPGPPLIRDVFARLGVHLTAVDPVRADPRRAIAHRAPEQGLFVKAVGRDQRDADLLQRLSRIRTDRSAPFASARHQLEHEEYLLLSAARKGVRVPAVRHFTVDRDGTAFLALELVQGQVLDQVAISDKLLDELWRQIHLLGDARVAHRDLRPENILVDDLDRLWLVGFGAGRSDASRRDLEHDRKALLALTTGLAGAATAIRAAGRAQPLAPQPALTVAKETAPAGPPSARHPGDVIRMVAGLALAAFLTLYSADGFLLTVEADLFRVINGLPDWFFTPVNVIMQAGALGAVAAASLSALLFRRVRLAVDLAAGGALAWYLARWLKTLADRGRPGDLLTDLVLRDAPQSGLGFVSGHAAVAAALATIAAAHVRRPVRRIFWVVAITVAVARVYVGAHFPFDVVAGAALGWAIGGAIHLARGTPAHLPSEADLTSGLRACGVEPVSIEPARVDARGSVPYLAVTAEGDHLFVKALGRDQRDADLLFKAARFLLYREREDETPYPTPRRQLAHEACMLMRAEAAGVRVPRFAGLATAGPGIWVLAEEAFEGATDLSRDGLLTDAQLRSLWMEVARLRTARIAHRDLRLANILIDKEGAPVLVDFGFAEDGASDHRLAQDVAELLVSTALLTGARTAVEAAADVLGDEAVADAATLLQPLAFARATRSALSSRPRLLQELRHAITARTGTPPPGLRTLSRLPSRPWLLAGGLAASLSLYVILFEVSDVKMPPAISPRWLLTALVLVACSYVAGAMTLMGATERPLALGRTVSYQLAASFASRQHEVGRGSESVLTAYLQSCGAGRADAVRSVAITRLTGAMVHAIAFVLALVTAVIERPGPVGWPSRGAVLILPATVLALGGALALARRSRDYLGALRGAARSLRGLAGRPGRAGLLLTGSAGVTSLSVLAFLAAARGVNLGLPPGTTAAIFLAVFPLRLLGPLPGGVGVVEPVLALALVAFGAGPTEAVLAVVIHRLLAFWLPALPGALAFRRTRRIQASP